MDQELLAAIKGILQEELDPIKQDIAGLDQKVTGLQQDMTGMSQDIAGLKEQGISLQKQSDFHHKYLSDARDDINDIKGSLFNVASDVRELKSGQMRMQDSLEYLKTMAEATQKAHRDHEKRIQALEDEITA